MSTIARAARPFASRVLSQTFPRSTCVPRFTPVRFPRGSVRSFSQSPFWQVKKYTESHEWVELDDKGIATIGISEYAAKSLGDVVYVELPTPDLEVAANEPVGAVESVKSASDVLSPVSGRVIEANSVLDDSAKIINASPEGDGWIAKVEVSDPSEIDSLLDAEAYKDLVGEAEDH